MLSKQWLVLFVIVNIVVVTYMLFPKSRTYKRNVDTALEKTIVTKVFRNDTTGLPCPKGHIVTVVSGGQLGNKIWEYMSLYAAYHLYKDEYNLEAFVPWEIKEEMETVFERTSLPVLESIPDSCRLSKREKFVMDFNDPFVSKGRLPEEGAIIELRVWSARYEFVVPYGFDNMRRELRFKETYVQYAQNSLKQLRDKYFTEVESVVFVGMHYRGTDYVRMLQSFLHDKFKELPSYRFYNKAMSYFQERYQNLIFILLTVDDQWLTENVEHFKKDVTLVINPFERDTIKDLSLLAHCNHSILTYGTYASTAALFADGETFVYDLEIPQNVTGFNLTHGLVYMLPNWHKLR